MENVRIAVLSADETVCTFFDNLAPEAMHYREASLHTYLQGSAYTMKIETDTYSDDTQYLVEGNKIAFVYKNRDYMCNIVSVERTETDITIDCLGLLLELTNETREAYKSNGAMTLAQYLNYIDGGHVLTLGINEVSNKSIANEWTGSQTVLARLYSIATLFDAELEFMTELNDNYSLKQITLNVYRAHSDKYQGMGTNRTDQILRFGTSIDVIRKTSDITSLYTGIRIIGKESANIVGIERKEYDSEGRLEYYTNANDDIIWAPLARDRFPSNVNKSNDRYITMDWTYDSEDKNVLYGQGLAQLKKNCVPQVTYEITGYYDANIGDTFTIVDDGYNPMLILEARVTEQEEYFVDPTKNQTTYSNVAELKSEINAGLLAAMQKLIADKKLYICNISTDNGTIFKNGVGATTLTAQVKDGAVDITDKYVIQWYKDGNALTAAKSVTVRAVDVPDKAVYKFTAFDDKGTAIGQYEATVTNVDDGVEGDKGDKGDQGIQGPPGLGGKTSYTHIAYANSADGKTDFSVDNSNRKYVGMYVDFTQADSTDPTKYSWSLIKGADGSNGTPGKAGADGKTPYFHVAYANSTDGKTGFSTTDSTDKLYIGQYTDYTQVDSTDPTKYSWTKIKGEDGKSSYTHIRYTMDAQGTGMTDKPSLWESSGRNLLLNSKGDDRTGWVMPAASVEDNEKGKIVQVSTSGTREVFIGSCRTKRIEQSTNYTFSCDVYINENVKNIDFFWLSDTEADPKSGGEYVNIRIPLSGYVPERNKWVRISMAFTTWANDYTGYIRIDNNGSVESGKVAVLKTANLKLEKGLTPTPWTPAPEDYPEDYVQPYIGIATTDSPVAPTDASAYTWSKYVGKDGQDGLDGLQGPKGEKGDTGNPGKDGTPGENAITGELSLSPIILPANASGAVTSYAGATGMFKLFDGTEEVTSGVAYNLVSATGVTASINSSTGAYTVSSMPNRTDYGTAMFKAVYQGVTVQKILAVIKSKQGVKGDTGSAGEKGDTGDSGIIISDTAPTNPYVGQLWQTASGAPIKRWDGSKWIIWFLDVSNLNVQNLSAISSTLGSVINPYDTTYEGEHLKGQVTISNALVRNDFTNVASGQKGYWILSPLYYSMYLEDSKGKQVAGIELSAGSFMMYTNRYNKWLNLSDEMLYDTGWVEFPKLKGTDGKIYARRYMGRRMLRFNYFVLNGTGDIAKLTGDFLPQNDGMYTISPWTATGSIEKIQLTSAGVVAKVSNTAPGNPITGFLEYF